MHNNILRFLPALLALALAFGAPQTSHALFGREKSRLLEQADAVYTEALAAGQQGRVLDEMTLFNEARAHYTRLFSQYPGYHAEHIQQMVAKCSLRIAALNAKIRSGEIAVPPPEAIADGAGSGFVAAGAAPSPAGEADGAPIPPLPPLVDADADADKADSTPPPEPPASIEPRATEEVPEPKPETPAPDATVFDKPIPSPAAPAEAKPGLDPSTPENASAPASAAPRTRSVLADADDAQRIRLVQAITDKDGPSQAMVMLEDLLEAEGDAASETTRALFVKTLMACRNSKRAALELDALRERHPDSPATRSLAAAVAAQTGNLTEAVYQLDKLIERHPAYSDAYVNLAYAYFMLDPAKNRAMAAVYYRSAISYGARRDPKLEEILDLEIVQ